MRLNKFAVAAILLSMGVVLLSGCAYFAPKTPIAKMADTYSIFTGVLVAPAELKNGNHRLIVYFNQQPLPSATEEKSRIMRDANGEIAVDTTGKVVRVPEATDAMNKDVRMCVAGNASSKQVLANVRDYLNDPKAQGKTIFIYGTPIMGSWEEYISGVYCSITAIGFYVPTTDSYTYVLTEYGDGVWDNFSWMEFIKTIGAQAVKKAL